MTVTRGLRPILLLALLLGLVVAPLGVTRPTTALAIQPALATWRGGVDLYRAGSFTTQRSWLWCTAAGVQIVRNIVEREADHTTSGQRRYFEWMRRHNLYDLPLSAGVDPQGWTAGLRHFVDDRYRLVSSRTFDEALRSAVERLRLTALPVAITVSHGNHGWILTGFRATADPATTSSFTVTSVRVVGPLYGLQSKNGYDMAPNTKLTPTQLKRFFTPWKYDPKPMVWDGRFVSIQPIPVKVAPAKPSRTPVVSAAPATPTPIRTPVASATMPGPLVAVAATPTPPARGGAGAVASPAPPPAIDPARVSSDGPPWPAVVLAGLVALAAIGASIAYRARPRSARRSSIR